MVGAETLMQNTKTAAEAAARGVAAAAGGAPQVDPHRVAQEMPPGSVGPVEARSPLFAHISTSQQADMKLAATLTYVRTRQETAAMNDTSLREHAQALEAQRLPVPATLVAAIADAGEKHAVAKATFNAKMNHANDEIAVAARQGDAMREWTARRSANELNGRPPPAKHELTHTYNEYFPAPPTDLPDTPENQAFQGPLKMLAHKLSTAREHAARKLEFIADLERRGGTPTAIQLLARDSALAAVGQAETTVCKILMEANKARLPEEAEADPDAAMMAKRTIAWVLGAPPPTALTPPPTPPSSPPPNFANTYAALSDHDIGDFEPDQAEYEPAVTPAPKTQQVTKSRRTPPRTQDSDDDDTRPRGKKTKIFQHEPQSQDPMTERTATTDQAEHNHAHNLALLHAAEARQALDVEHTAALTAMETPDEPSQPTAEGMAAARSLTEAALQTPPETQNTEPETGEAGGKRSAAPPHLSAIQVATLPKATRLTIAANRKFFHLLSPRLDGITDPPPCPKCDLPDCYLQRKSEGRLAPFQAQLLGAVCRQHSAPSVCMSAWFALGITDAILGTATSGPAGGPKQPQTATPPTAMTNEQRRANEQEKAILAMEQALAKLTRELSASTDEGQRLEAEYARQKAELKKVADSRTASFAVAAANLAELRAAHIAGTVPMLTPVPDTYTPIAPPHTPTHRERMIDAAARAPYNMPRDDFAPFPTQPSASRRYETPPGFPTLQEAAELPNPPKTAVHERDAVRRAEMLNTSYATALARTAVPTGARVSARTRPNRAEVSMLNLDFILITNFNHQAIGQTKKAFSELLETGTDIMHYRRMPGDGLELTLPRWQKQDVSAQLRQLNLMVKPNYHPAEKMVRRRRDESDTRAREREAFCAHHAFSKVVDAPGTQPVVRAWFARAMDIMEQQCPTAFTTTARGCWTERLGREAEERRGGPAPPAGKTTSATPGTDVPPPPPPPTMAGTSANEAMTGTEVADGTTLAGGTTLAEKAGEGAAAGEQMQDVPDEGTDGVAEDTAPDAIGAATSNADGGAEKTAPDASGADTTSDTATINARENALPGDK